MRRHPNSLAGIYRITCSIDGKVYIGQAKKVSQRWTGHRWHLEQGTHRNADWQAAWDQYGPDAFTWEIVAQPIGPHDPETMTYLEVEVLRSYPDSYNLMVPIQAYLGAKDSTRAKLSAERLARWSDPEYKARLKAAHAEKRSDPEYRKRHRQAMLALNSTPEGAATRKRASAKAAEKWTEDSEIKRAQSERHKALWADPEYRARMKAARQASWADPEKRARRIAGLKKGWENLSEEDRQKRVEAASAKQRTEEGRKAAAERMREVWDSGKRKR